MIKPFLIGNRLDGHYARFVKSLLKLLETLLTKPHLQIQIIHYQPTTIIK